MSTGVYILGGSQTDFSRNWAREDLEVFNMFAEVLRDAVVDARILRRDTRDDERKRQYTKEQCMWEAGAVRTLRAPYHEYLQ